jgi:DNA (cytosine-5)-methyltransferase 1
MDTSTKEELRQLKKDGSHLHTSPPCQGFSGANRNGGQNDRANNDLSLTFVDGVKLLQPPTASFENVMGMWRRKHVHYLKYIVAGLMKLGYQVRCCPLKACDYGDPQKRERLFIFASRGSIPLPRTPTKTHGEERGLLPYVTVKDTLVTYQHLSDAEKAQIPNMSGRSTSLKVGQHGLVQLDPDGLAPAVRAKSVPPIHYDGARCINVREAAALQSFPSNYVFCGKLQEQYQQVGNAVPVELASAIARSIRQSAMFYYDE